MRSIIINDNNLKDEDIDYSVTRVKAFIINSNGLLLVHNNNTYQFPGGHVEKGEDYKDTLMREIKEETGIDVDKIDDPFLEINTYDNDYFGSNSKVLNKIYYFIIHTDSNPNIDSVNLDLVESETPFVLCYIKDNELEDFINQELEEGTIDKKIAREMLLAYDAYQYINEEVEVI